MGLPEMTGATLPLMAASEGVDLASGAEIAELSKSAQLLYHTLRGGTAFAAYEAGAAKENKGVAGLKGFAIGAIMDGGLSLAGKLIRRGVVSTADKALSEALTPGRNIDPLTDEAVTEQVLGDQKIAREEGRPGFMREDPTAKGARVQITKKDGSVVEEPIHSGREDAALSYVQFYLQQGGDITGITYHPDRVDTVNRFLQLSESAQTSKYQTRTIPTEPGTAPQVAADMQLQGHVAETAGPNKVQISQPKRSVPSRDQISEALSGGGDEDFKQKYTNIIRQIWNPQVPFKNRILMRDQIERVLGTSANKVLPDEFQVPEKVQGIYKNRFEQWVYQEGLENTWRNRKGYFPEQMRLMSNLFDSLHGYNPRGEFLKDAYEDLEKLESFVGRKLPDDLLPFWVKRAPSPSVIEAAKELGVDVPETVQPKAPALEYEESRSSKVSRLYNIVTQVGYGHGDTIEKAETILSSMGIDPAKVDIDELGFAPTVEKLSDMIKSEEILQSAEKEIEFKSRGIESPGAIEEAVRKGEVAKPSGARIPFSERVKLVLTGKGPRVQVSSNDARIALKVSPRQLEEIYPGARALIAYPNVTEYADIFNKLGVTEIDPKDPRPLHLYTDKGQVVEARPGKTYPSDVWHENAHIHIYNAGGGATSPIYTRWGGRSSLSTAKQIGKWLRDSPAYEKTGAWELNEEAYVHAATAVRVGDFEALSNLADADTSIRHVLDMVTNFSQDILDNAAEQIDSNSIRMAQRSIEYVKAKASREFKYEVNRLNNRTGAYAHFDPSVNGWKYTTNDGKVTIFPNSGQLFDHIDKQDGSTFAPSASLWAEYRGVRGRLTPEGTEPGKNIPMPEATPGKDQKWVGWNAISGAWRPMLPWVATVDEKMNNLFSSKGQRYPLYNTVKAVDDALKIGDDWLINQKEVASEFLKGNPKKLYEYMDALTTSNGVAQDWKWIKDKFKLDDSDFQNLTQAEKWLKDFQNDTHIPAFNYLREQLPKLRGFNYNMNAVYGGRAKETADMSFFHRSMVEGSLDPKDAHLGRFINFLIREGFEKKFTGEPIQALRKLVDAKGADDKYILGSMRWPLDNYIRYVKGIPDISQQAMVRGMGDFQKFLGEKFKHMNQYLPEGVKLPEEFNYPGNAIQRLMTLSYVGTLGARPAIMVRDTFQAITNTLPVLGFRRFFTGLTKGLTREGLDLSEANGALLSKTNVGELYGDIFNEMPAGGNLLDRASKLSNKLLAPSRWGHNAARNIAYNGEYHTVLDAVQRYRTGAIDASGLLDKANTSFWFFDKPETNMLLKMASDSSVPAEAVAHRSAMQLVDLTLWPYRRGAQPTVLRTGLGRIFGQYGMWPLNYIDFISRLGKKFAEHPQHALSTVATWGAANYAAVQTLEGIFHADVGKWFYTSPMGYAGSPNMEFIQNVMKGVEETDEGRQARKRALQYPLDFIPAYNEMRQVIRAMDEGGPLFQDGHMSDNLTRVLGFKPLDETHEQRVSDLSPEERLNYELGYKRVSPTKQ